MHTNIVLGNLHRPPRNLDESYKSVMKEINLILGLFKYSIYDLILVGNLNIDLLKINVETIFN